MLETSLKDASFAIDVHDLTKQFGDFTAVDQVSLQLPYGQILGYLGANGAGKSTTIRMLTGILKPTSGKAKVAGIDLFTDVESVKKHIGYVSQRFSLYEDLTVRENLEFFASIYNLSDEEKKARIEQVMQSTELHEYQHRLAGDLSGGWKQRLAISNAILHKPKVLFLDEPTAGLDPLVRRLVWQLLYDLAQSGMALFVTTHYMEEAERCHQLAIISHGKILLKGTPDEIRSSLHHGVLSITCTPLLLASRVFQQVPGVKGITVYSHTLNINLEPSFNMEKLEACAREHHIMILQKQLVEPTLEDVFAALESQENFNDLTALDSRENA